MQRLHGGDHRARSQKREWSSAGGEEGKAAKQRKQHEQSVKLKEKVVDLVKASG